MLFAPLPKFLAIRQVEDRGSRACNNRLHLIASAGELLTCCSRKMFFHTSRSNRV